MHWRFSDELNILKKKALTLLVFIFSVSGGGAVEDEQESKIYSMLNYGKSYG